MKDYPLLRHSPENEEDVWLNMLPKPRCISSSHTIPSSHDDQNFESDSNFHTTGESSNVVQHGERIIRRVEEMDDRVARSMFVRGLK